MVLNGRGHRIHESPRRVSSIESLIAAGSKSALRHGTGASETITFTQKMRAPSEKLFRNPATKRKDVHKKLKVQTENRRHHLSMKAEQDSDDDYV